MSTRPATDSTGRLTSVLTTSQMAIFRDVDLVALLRSGLHGRRKRFVRSLPR